MARPRVSIGLPVYNGENYLQSAIESVLEQTMEDFELIISDNASTDRTQQICEAAVAADPRIRYERQSKNYGAAPNYNRTFELARGLYFKWLAHDDLIRPTFLEACLSVFEEQDDVVVACTRIEEINLDDGASGEIIHNVQGDDPRPHIRFREFLNNPYCYQIFGVIRSDVLRKTDLIGKFSGSDNCLMGVLSLHGRVFELPDMLQVMRDHPGRSTRAYPHKLTRSVWFDSSFTRAVDLPMWRAIRYYLRGLYSAPLSPLERGRAAGFLADWMFRRRGRVLAGELRQKLRMTLHHYLPTKAYFERGTKTSQ